MISRKGGSVTKKVQGTVLVKWVRSGIGFPQQQKVMVRSLGLRRLHHIVERPDNAHIRGLVASIPHLVEIVGETPASALSTTPEYKIGVPAAASAPPAKIENAGEAG